jgi:acyl carrier protein
METQMETKIIAALLSVVQRRNGASATVTTDQPLQTLGLDSLDLAQLVAVLEAELGLDPFASRSIASIRTVGVLCRAYAESASPK